jgi:succinate dehydrogenase / fumarate reductase cytochrome b subunit
VQVRQVVAPGAILDILTAAKRAIDGVAKPVYIDTARREGRSQQGGQRTMAAETKETGKMHARPLSPHLQIYRPQITSVLSITHRITGVALATGTLLLVWWLAAAALGEAAYARVGAFVGSPIGLLLLFGWSLALFYHLANGIRHLFWDTGRGFDLSTAEKSGYAVLAFALAATVVAWTLGFAVLGGR